MGVVVGSFGTSHILMSAEGVEEQAERVFAGMQELGKCVQATEPTALVLITGDHMFNVNMAQQIPLMVGVADEYVPFGDMGIAKRPFPGHRALAELFVEHAAERGYDIAKAEELQPDHGITLPLLFCNPGYTMPVVPVLINTNMTPLPRPKRCYGLGTVLREAIECYLPANERVAVIGTGGLSHWLNVPGMGNVNVEFDRYVIDEITAGRAEHLATLSAADFVEKSGNGGIETVAWLMAAATLPGRKGSEIYYEPMPTWLTGMAGIAIPA